MVTKKTTKAERLLTGAELEIMSAVWESRTATVREVQERLPADRKLAYTSVATLLKILEQKGFLTVSKGERTLTYQPVIARADYEATTLRHLTQKLFQGNPSSLVMRMLDESDLSREDLKSLRELLNKKLGK
jgi:predicted transcriptional regulator